MSVVKEERERELIKGRIDNRDARWTGWKALDLFSIFHCLSTVEHGPMQLENNERPLGFFILKNEVE